MLIDRILYPVTTLGPGKRVVIWTIGCPRRCRNCSNPELWAFDTQRDIDIKDIISFIEKIDGCVDGITITGGEPFAQEEELQYLLEELRDNNYSDILVYSGYEYDYLCQNNSNILALIDVVIAGEYIDELNDNKGIRGSSNQSIVIINDQYKNRYDGFDICKRESQIIYHKQKAISVGIPIKN